jgi:hypothetical protein
MRPSEALAKRIIEGVHKGSRMIYREDQSVRTHDFDLHETSSSVAAVEVTSINDAVVKATHAAIDRYRWIPRRLCSKDWRVHPASDAVIKRIAHEADAYLARIEIEGIDEFFGPRDAAELPAVHAIWRELRVIGGSVFPWKQPGIGIAFPVTGGAVGLNLVMLAMDEVAHAGDNRLKLAASGATDRHLAIYVDRSATKQLIELRDFEPPQNPPDLPDEITDVWIFSEDYGTERYVVWCAHHDRVWQRFVLAGNAGSERLVVMEGPPAPRAG